LSGKLLRRLCVNLLLPLLIGAAAAEIIGEFWLDDPFAFDDYRFRFDTPDVVRNVGEIWAYQPNRDIRELTYYKRPFGEVFEEADCRHTSDGAGFLDNPSDSKTYDVLLLGDSFTAGVDGCAWVDQLRALAPHLTIYNGALRGIGVENWAAELDYLQGQGYRFDHVVVVYIADDFFRALHRWDERDLRCLHDIHACTAMNSYYPLEPGMDTAALARRRAEANGFWAELKFWLKRNLWVMYFIAEGTKHRFTRDLAAITPATRSAFDRLAAAAGSIRFVKTDQKDEAALGARNGESRLADRFLAERSVAFDHCPLRYDDFSLFDTHPTSRGYSHLAQCVAETVRRLQRPPNGPAIR
jgi:hypothetical protein